MRTLFVALLCFCGVASAAQAVASKPLPYGARGGAVGVPPRGQVVSPSAGAVRAAAVGRGGMVRDDVTLQRRREMEARIKARGR